MLGRPDCAPQLAETRQSLTQFPTATAVALVQSNLGPSGNLELIVRLQPRPATGGPDYLASFFFEGSGQPRRGPINLVADGQPVSGVTGF